VLRTKQGVKIVQSGVRLELKWLMENQGGNYEKTIYIRRK
jgi:hypothetical protein